MRHSMVDRPQIVGDDRDEAAALPAFLGVELKGAEDGGAFVKRVIPSTAAETAGLQADDRILGIAGWATDTADEVRSVLAERWSGDRVQLVFRRGRQLHVVETTLGARPPSSRDERPEQAARVLEVLQLVPGSVVADIGFGGGWLSVAMSKAVGEEGRVYALEVNRAAVQQMRERGVPNIEVVQSKPDDVSLPPGVLDTVVLHDVASHIKQDGRPQFYASLATAMKAEGRLFVFDPHGKARTMLDELAGYGFRAKRAAELDQLSVEDLDQRLSRGIEFEGP